MRARRSARSSPASQQQTGTVDRGRLRIAIAVVLVLSLGLTGLIAGLALWPRHSTPAQPKAVIVDQLAATDPDPQFVADAARQLEAAGYHVDYYKPSEVTVDFYRTLPELGYKFIVLRSHASDETHLYDGTTVDTRVSIGIFTNELYSRSVHLADQRALRLTVDSYTDRNIQQRFFGITPDFIAHSVQGQFNGATVLLMGCAGLKATDLAQAFVSRGVANFIGWDGAVTAAHTDAGTEKLLQNLFSKHLDVRTAVAKTSQEIGPDPSYGGRLLEYP